MSQLSIEARPTKFEEVAGQSIAKAILKAICKDPDSSPKVIQLYGGFGCGKTSLARVFASQVNKMPYEELTTSPFLQELDSSQLNKETIRTLIESWYATPTGGYRVIVIDENHLLSKDVQSALLKVLEDMPKNTFIVFATTDYDKVLNTIKSRSLEIKLELVSNEDMRENIQEVCEKFNIPMTKQVEDRIIEISHGHMRTAHMNISKYEMLGEEQYLSLFKSAYSQINNFFLNAGQKNRDGVYKSIDEILQFPLMTIKEDFNKYMLDFIKTHVSGGNDITKLFGANAIAIFKLTQSDWFKSCFDSDVELQTGLLCFYQSISPSQQTQARPAQTADSHRGITPGARR